MPDFRQEQRLKALILGGHEARPINTMSSPSTAPRPGQQVHQVRLAAMGMHSRTDVALGDRPVPPPLAMAGGQIQRVQQPVPAWAAREAMNWPFLYPDRFITTTDLLDFQVLQRSPSLVAAITELVIASGDRVFDGEAPTDAVLGPIARPELLSPLASTLLRLMPPAGPFQTTVGGALARGFTHLFAQVGHAFTVAESSLTGALGPAGAELWSALREAVPAARGLQNVMHRAQLPLEPVDPDTPLTREEAHSLVRNNPQQLDIMMAVAPIPSTLPALQAAKAQIAADAFKDLHVVAVQHVLATNATLFMAMEAHGLKPANTEIVGIPYSTNYVVEHMFRRAGYAIDTPLVIDPNEITAAYERAVEAALDRAVARASVDGKPILLLDDGGKAAAVAARKYPHLGHLFRGVEQTTRGLTEIASVEKQRGAPMPFLIVDVAKSPLKAHEMPKIGEQVASEVTKLTRLIGLDVVTDKDVVVVGFGPIGEGVARALQVRGARVSVWDMSVDGRARAAAAGFHVPHTREAALADKALVVGATGHRSVGRDDLALLAPGCVLASASSRDVEIDLSVNRDKDIESVPLLTSGRGDQRFVTRVWRLHDKDIVVLKNGFPLNFNGDYETGTAADIEQTRALMLLAAAQAVGGLPSSPPTAKAGLVPLSLAAQRDFARAFGITAPV